MSATQQRGKQVHFCQGGDPGLKAPLVQRCFTQGASQAPAGQWAFVTSLPHSSTKTRDAFSVNHPQWVSSASAILFPVWARTTSARRVFAHTAGKSAETCRFNSPRLVCATLRTRLRKQLCFCSLLGGVLLFWYWVPLGTTGYVTSCVPGDAVSTFRDGTY